MSTTATVRPAAAPAAARAGAAPALLPALIRAWRRVALAWVTCLSIAAAYAFLAPNWYEAQLSVIPTAPPKAASGLAAALAGELPIDIGVSSDADRIQAVFHSRSVSDAVIHKFSLLERYHKRTIESAREALWTHCLTRIEKRPSVVTLSCEDTDPETARAITGHFGEIGNQAFVRVSTSAAASERKFLEQRVQEARKDMNRAAERLRAFQEQHKVIDLTEQSKAVVSAMAKLKGDLLSKQLELSYLSSFSSADESTAVQLRQQIAILERQLQSLEDTATPQPGDKTPDTKPRKSEAKDIFPTVMSVPRLRFDLEQLFRDQKIEETVFLLLTQRLEMAKMNEARDTPAFQILDAPVTPTQKSRPKRLPILLFGALLGLLAGAGWVLWPLRLSPWLRALAIDRLAGAT
jgi:uncharacterized protein involved in exopolysaccharide biosynthesis